VPRFRQEAAALMLISRDEHQMLVVSVVLVPLVLSLRADFGGVVDIAFHGGGVDAYPFALLDALPPSIVNKHVVNHLEGFRPKLLDVVLQGRETGDDAERDAAELPQDNGIVHPVRQLAITEFLAKFDDGETQHLIGRHALGAGLLLGPPIGVAAEVLMDQVSDLRIFIENLAHFFPLLPGFDSGRLEVEGPLRIVDTAHFQGLSAVGYGVMRISVQRFKYTISAALCQGKIAPKSPI
jgi:hypothetical protein